MSPDPACYSKAGSGEIDSENYLEFVGKNGTCKSSVAPVVNVGYLFMDKIYSQAELKYKQRRIFSNINMIYASTPVIVVTGARQVGKSEGAQA